MSTDPTALAREVLEREERLSAYTYSIPLAAQASWDATRSEQVKAAPDLARAVIDLAATVKRMAELADQYGAEVRPEFRERDAPDTYSTQATAARILAALNGETDD